MKKSILALAVFLGATTTFAQDLTSRKGENYLPEAGDWAIGIDGVPLLNYLGNFFGKQNDNTFANSIWGYSNPSFLITGKYFTEDQFAFRGGIRIGFNSEKDNVLVGNRSANPANWPNTDALVENSWKRSNTNVGLNFGVEWRKGNTRLQGYYGAEIGFLIQGSKTTFEYGNALAPSTATIPVEVSADDNFGSNTFTTFDGNGSPILARVTEDKDGTRFSIGLRAFIGAEYFIIPKLSIGGEFGWGIGFTSVGAGSTTYETVGYVAGAADSQIATITSETAKSSTFGLDVSTVNPLFGPAGRLNLTFHF